MNSWKKSIILFFLVVFISHATNSMALKVEMVSNTDQCIVDCETIYNITAEDQKFVFDENNYWFEFGDNKNESLRHAKDVNNLQGFEILYPVIEQVSDVETYCIQSIINDSENYSETCEFKTRLKYYNVTRWENLIKKQPFTLKPKESITIKIKGKKYPAGKVDNVLVLLNPEEKKYVKYDQWIWWDAVWANRTNLNLNDSLEADSLTARIIINTTLSLGCAKLNLSDLRVVWQNSSTAEERDYYFHNFTTLANNPSNKTIVLYFNSTNKVGTHYVYCGNTQANSSTANGFHTFYLFDDFNDASFNSSKWGIAGAFSSLTESGGGLTLTAVASKPSGIGAISVQGDVFQNIANVPAFAENDTILFAWSNDLAPIALTTGGGCSVTTSREAKVIMFLKNSTNGSVAYHEDKIKSTPPDLGTSGVFHVADSSISANTTSVAAVNRFQNLTEIIKYNITRVNFTEWVGYAIGTSDAGIKKGTRTIAVQHFAAVDCHGVGGGSASTSQTINWIGVGKATSANTSLGLLAANAMDLTVLSQSTPNPVREGSVGTFASSINVSIDQNFYNNISRVNFTYNGTVYTTNPSWFISNSTFLNTTFFNITLNVPLITYNSTNITYSWSFMQQGNLSDGLVAITPTNTTTIVWESWINNVTWQSPVFSGTTNTFLLNLTCDTLVNCGLNQTRNLTIEYNGVNQTIALLTNNQSNSGFMEYKINITAPVVTNTLVVNWTAWVNITFSNGTPNNMFIARKNSSSIRIMNGTQVVVTDGEVSSNTFDTPVFETSIQNYTLAVFNSSVSIVNVNFTYDNFGLISGTAITNSSTGNVTNFTTMLITSITAFNQSNVSLQWNYTLSNGAKKSSNLTNQTILWAYYVNNVTWTTPVTEGASNNFIINMTKHVSAAYLNTSFYINTTIEYNNTNQSLGVLIDNQTSFEVYNLTMIAPTGADIIHNWTSWLNVTQNPVSFNRMNRSLTQVVNGTQLVIGDGTIFNTSWNTPVFETSLANFTINISNTTLSIVNIRFGWNSTVVNGGSISNLSTSNGTIFNTSLRLPLVPLNLTNISFVWNWTMSGGQTRTSNNTTQQILWAHYPNQLLISAAVTEGDSQTATVNATKHIFIGGTTRTANIEYNGTNISTALVVNSTSYSDYNATFITSLVSGDTNVQAKGWLQVDFGSNSYIRNTSNSSQLIANVNITAGTNCTNVSGFTAVLNFTFHDEFTNLSLAENGSSQITIWNTTQSSNQTFGFKFFNTTFHTICLKPPVNFTGEYFLQYENWTNSTASYPEREFWKRNQSIDNVTDQYHLYSILFSNSTDIIFNVQDSNGDPAPNVIVEALKYNISNNSFMLVDSGITDFDGKTRLRLYRADDYYKIIARDGSGRLVLETSLFKLLFTEYFLRLEPFGLTTIATVIQLKNIPHNLTFDNGTMRAVLTWNDVMNVSGQSCLEITNMTGNNTGIIVNKQCSTNLSGSFQYDFTGLNGSYVAKYVTGTNSFLVDAIDVLLSGFTNLGRSGLFLAFILIGTFTAVGVVINPTLGIVFFMVGFIGTWLTGLLQISWLPFTGVIAICLIAAFVLKKDIV